MAMTIALAAVAIGVSGIANMGLWWRVSRRLVRSARPGRSSPEPDRPTALWKVNVVLGALVQIAFGIAVIGYLILAAVRHVN